MDSIFPLTPGTACQHVNERLLLHARLLTSRDFKNALKDSFVDEFSISSDDSRTRREETYNQVRDLIFYGLLLR